MELTKVSIVRFCTALVNGHMVICSCRLKINNPQKCWKVEEPQNNSVINTSISINSGIKFLRAVFQEIRMISTV